MRVTVLDQAISDALAGLLLRYFRNGELVEISGGVTTTSRDAEFLLFHWAISDEVRALAHHLCDNPHETQAILEIVQHTSSGVLRGSVDARSTLLSRRSTGNSAMIVSRSPQRTADHGLNRLLAWVLNRAVTAIEYIVLHLAESSPYRARISSVRGDIDQCAKNAVLREIIHSIRPSVCPTAQDVVQATRHRRRVYRLAAQAYRLLRQIEGRVPEAVGPLLRRSLIAPLEPWRRFELFVAISIASAIQSQCNDPIELSIIGGAATSQPIARCGKYEVYWQARTPHYTAPALEASEERAAEICTDYGLTYGGDRPDVVVVDKTRDAVVCLAEAKHMSASSSGAEGACREAIDQLVRYSRGYGDGVLERSLLCVSKLPDFIGNGRPNENCPYAIDAPGLLSNALAAWARDVVSAPL